MRRISIRELHESTGRLVREAARNGYVVTDRGRPVAKLVPADDPEQRPSLGETVLKRGFVAKLKPGKKTLSDYISEDRDTW